MDRFRRDVRRHRKTVSVGIVICSLVFIWSIALIAVLYYFFGEIKSEDHVTVNITNEKIWILQKPKLWYMNGTLYPVRTAPDSLARIWPEQAPKSPIVRIHNQLMLAPKSVAGTTKLVVFWSHWQSIETYEIPMNRCPVNSCMFTSSRDQAQFADAVVFRDTEKLLQDYPAYYRKRTQIWIFSNMGLPEDYVHPIDVYNWTATYRLDSDLPLSKYGFWMYYDQRVKENPTTENAVLDKTLLVAWFPSSCDKTSKSYKLAYRLGYYIFVDIYGKCGDLECPQNKQELCLKILKDKYKFYLAFEDEYCNDYVPDSFYLALQANAIPVVMGLPRSFYERVVPENSFIHVDDFNSTQELANHLNRIGKDDKLFNSYFSWRGTGEFVNGWYCRLCAVLNSDHPNRMIQDINDWWIPDGVCKK